MDTFYAGLGRFVVRFRYAIIVGWIVFGGVCVAAFPSLSSVVKTQQSDFLPSGSPSRKAQQLELGFNPQGNELASLTPVAVARSGSLTPEDHSAISRFEDQIRGFAHVQSVQDLSISPDGRP